LTAQGVEEPAIQKIAIAELVYDKTNPNRMTKEQMQGLQESMKRFGYLTPVIIDQNNKIADGEHRVEVYKQFGLTEIPAYKVNFKDDIERRMLRQTMNKLHGIHDKPLDANELVIIFQNDRLDDLAKIIAQDKEDMQRLMSRYHPGLEFVTAENETQIDQLINDELKREAADTQPGDIYQLGNHRLMCADCSDKRSVDRLLEDVKPGLLLTDPPYGISIVKVDGGKIGGDKPITVVGHVGASKIAKANEYRIIEGDDKPYDPGVVLGMADNHIMFGANYYADKLPKSPGWIVWYKRRDEWDRTTFAECELAWSDFEIPARMYSVVWMGIIKEGEHEPRVHPTQKPVKLIASIISDFSSKGQSVIDPYAGSGSTLLACEQTDRTCYAAEIDPHYCDITIKRWEMYTGKKAVKLSQ